MIIRRGFWKKVFLPLVFLISLSFIVADRGYALTASEMDVFSQNNILFYEPCGQGGKTIGGPCGGEIVGATAGERMIETVEKYGVAAMNMQIEYGIPWEIPFIHMYTESHMGLSAGVSGAVTDCGYYNWMGYTYGSISLYGIPKEQMPCAVYHDNGHLASMYESVGDMMGALATDYLRNGFYDKAFDYATQENFDLEMFLATETDGIYCAVGCSSLYTAVLREQLPVIHEVAEKMGWPTSEELMKQENIQKGGKYPVNGDVKEQINAEPHSLHMGCSGSGAGISGGSGMSNGLYTGDGSDVTIIGDSITVYNQAHNSYDEKLPNADIYAQSSKSWEDDDLSNRSGLVILEEIVDQGKLRDNLVFALGSNDGNGVGGVSEEGIQKMLDLASEAKRIVILTNYYVGASSEYSVNNERFEQLANENPKVILADWKTAASADPDKYMADVVHPTKEGSDLSVSLIVEALGGSGGKSSASDDACGCKDNPVTVSGGLTDEQIDKIIEYYTSDEVDTASFGLPNKDNCVTFSAFFIREFAHDNTDWYGNGKVVTTSLGEAGYDTGDEPQIFSVFSKSNTSMPEYGHTGIVVAVNGDQVVTIEASLNSGRYAFRNTYSKEDIVNTYGPKYAYFSDKLDTSALSKVLGGDLSLDYNSNSGGVANSDVTWTDGWITGGLDGYVKEDVLESDYRVGDSAHTREYTTNNSNGVAGPNKITLHSTEGSNGDGTSGLALYGNDGSGIYPAHFTIDMKNRRVFQHLPITSPSDAVVKYDQSAGVQIEIVGFSGNSHADDSFYLLDENNYGQDEWAYLGELLAAISSETGIPLQSDVDWTKESRLSESDFEAYEGVLGHMHVPENDHTDPGNIWPMVQKSLQGQAKNDCSGNKSWTGDFPWWDQSDPRWGGQTYGGYCSEPKTIGSSGCGVVSFAMLATALTGVEHLPSEVGEAAEAHREYSCGEGSSHSLPIDLADEFGLVAEMHSGASMEEINELLRDGWMIWTCGEVTPPYTGAGHCIGIRGITNDGKWLVADSNGETGRVNTLETEWDPEQVMTNMSSDRIALRRR